MTEYLHAFCKAWPRGGKKKWSPRGCVPKSFKNRWISMGVLDDIDTSE